MISWKQLRTITTEIFEIFTLNYEINSRSTRQSWWINTINTHLINHILNDYLRCVFGFPWSVIGDKSQIVIRSFKWVRLHYLQRISPIAIKWYYNRAGYVFVKLVWYSLTLKDLCEQTIFVNVFFLRCVPYLFIAIGGSACVLALCHMIPLIADYDYLYRIRGFDEDFLCVSLYHCDTWSLITLSQCRIIYDVF